MYRLSSPSRAAAIAAVAGAISLSAGLLGADAALASPNPAIVTITETPTFVRGGDQVTTTINGQTSGYYSFTGCFARQNWDGVWQTYDYAENEFYPAETFYEHNYFAYDRVFTSQGYEGVTCPLDNSLPVGNPTWSIATRTVTPSLEIDPVTVEIGVTPSDDISYSLYGPGGQTNLDVSAGAHFSSLPDAQCTLNGGDPNLSSLPAGLGIDSTVSLAGQFPDLKLTGTAEPGTEGSYLVCMNIQNELNQDFDAWMTVTVVPASLANTGRDSALLAGIAGVSVLALAAGAILVLRRRRLP
jgi:LPXTG-motif cell wall-anchored protein